MASRLGLRLAARSLRQPVALAPRTQAGRRAMSSAAPQQSSDAPWIAFAGIITVGGLAAIFAGGDSKPAHHESSPASKPKAPPKEEPKEESKKEEPPKKDEAPKGDDSKAAADNVEGSVSPAEVKESIERSIKADEPSTAKAEEVKSTGSPKKDSNSGSESGDDDFVKIEKISTKDTVAALAQSEKADAPAIAKPTEEKEARSKSGSNYLSCTCTRHTSTPFSRQHYCLKQYGGLYALVTQRDGRDLADAKPLAQRALHRVQSSGVAVNQECIEAYQKIKLGKKEKYVIFKLSDDLKQIIVDKISSDSNANTPEKEYDAFIKILPPNEPRWAVFDVQFEKDGGKRNKLTFFSWSPDEAKIKAKMVYASSRDALRRSLDGIAAEIQGTDLDEIAWEPVLEKVSRGF